MLNRESEIKQRLDEIDNDIADLFDLIIEYRLDIIEPLKIEIDDIKEQLIDIYRRLERLEYKLNNK